MTAVINPLAVLTKYFESAGQTITSGGLLTIAHGLGRRPVIFEVFLRCITAQAGWVAGNEVLINPQFQGSSLAEGGQAIYDDAANIYVRVSNSGSAYDLPNKGSGGGVSLTNANWELFVRALA